MKSFVLCCWLAISAFGQSPINNIDQVTPVAGESWLKHLNRSFEETSMGKTGRLGPATSTEPKENAERQGASLSFVSKKQTVNLHGSDLYRLNCWGCHGEFGLGAPPEINSVINPTRATSARMVLERMKSLGMDMSRAEASQLANQSKAALLQRLHNGGTDMPPFAHLSEPEVFAIVAYLKLLAGVPGAENQQVAVQESPVRVGEHIVKSTCHICHNAAGLNPTPAQIFDGMIPPLSTLTARMSLPKFERKIRSGAPIMMGTPPSPFRGRMPVFYYLTEDEAADAYLYLDLYPPDWTSPDHGLPVPEPKRAASEVASVELIATPKSTSPKSNVRDYMAMVFPVSAEIFVALLLGGGFCYTLLEIRRIRLAARSHNGLVTATQRVAHNAFRSTASTLRPARQRLMHSNLKDGAAVAIADEGDDLPFHDEQRFHHDDYRTFESSWLPRWLQGEDEAA